MKANLIVCLLLPIFAQKHEESCEINTNYNKVAKANSQVTTAITRFNDIIASLSNTTNTTTSKLKELEIELNHAKGVLATNFQKLNLTETRIASDQKNVSLMFDQMKNLTHYQDSIDSIVENATSHQKNLEKLLKLAEESSKKCQNAKTEYKKFQELVKGIFKNYTAVRAEYDKANARNKDVNKETILENSGTMKNYKDFGEISVPTVVVENYIASSQKEILKIIQHLKENVDLLKSLLNNSRSLWQEQVKANFENTKKDIKAITDTVNSMNKNLSSYEDALKGVQIGFLPPIDENSTKLLDKINRNIDKLELDYTQIRNSVDFDEIDKVIEQLEHKRLMFNYLLAFFEALPNAEKAEKIGEEIKHLKKVIRQVEKQPKFQEEYELLKRNVEEILKINCTEAANGRLLEQ